VECAEDTPESGRAPPLAPAPAPRTLLLFAPVGGFDPVGRRGLAALRFEEVLLRLLLLRLLPLPLLLPVPRLFLPTDDDDNDDEEDEALLRAADPGRFLGCDSGAAL